MTLRQYKKKYFICYDDNKKKIYVGDTVELQISHETNTSYKSIVYWNMLDGAYVDCHPAHKTLNNKNRKLSDYIKYNSKCIKVTDIH